MLRQKLKETQARCELLIAQSRRARTVSAANKVHSASTGRNLNRSMTRLRMKVLGDEAVNSASRLMLDNDMEDPLSDSLEDRFQRLEQDERIESMLSKLKLLSDK